MVQATGYHVVKFGYGLLLRGDDRGSWSEVWDERIGYIEPHTLHAANWMIERFVHKARIVLLVHLRSTGLVHRHLRIA